LFSSPSERVEDTPTTVAQSQPQAQNSFGGGFIAFLFGDPNGQSRQRSQQWYEPPPRQESNPGYEDRLATYAPAARSADRIDPRFIRKAVAYDGRERPATSAMDTPNNFPYLAGAGGRASRYGIGAGPPGFPWSAPHAVSEKKEWPDWTPPEKMLRRQPYLPHF